MFLPIFFIVTISTCFASDVSESPPFRCGEMPPEIYRCLHLPTMVKAETIKSCGTSINECERMTCVFTNSGWIKDGNVDKPKVMAHFDQFAKEYPQWSTALGHAKEACLTSDLPTQGVYLNCPAYDIMFCYLINFVQHALPSQWSNEARCQYPKQYGTSCPMCPSDCFRPLVPYGSCKACLGLPRSP